MSRKLLVLLALLGVGLIVAYWVWGRDFNWTLFVSSLSRMKAGWLAVSVLMTIATYGFRAARWQILLAPLKALGIWPLFSVTLVGFSAIFLLGRAGEIARPLLLVRREKIPLTGSIATIIVERVLDSTMVILFFVAALFIADVPEESSELLQLLKGKAWLIATLVGVALAVLFLMRSNASWIVRKVPFRRLAPWIDSFMQGLSFLRNGKTFGLVVLQSILLWIAIALQFWTMLLGMNFSLSIGLATLVMVGAAIGSIVQIPGIGGGFQAGYILCMTALLRIPKEQALATSLMATVVSFAPTVVIAGLIMLSQGFSMRELKRSVQKAESETI